MLDRRRRQFITLLGSAAAWPLAALAQQTERMRQVGLILPYAQDDPEAQSRVKAFRYGLRDVDWVEGRNIRIDYRFTGINPTQIKQSVAGMVSLAPDLIVANTTPVLTALRQATSTIPIVFSAVNDPIGQGFVSSLARPGGNITGFSFIEYSIVGKWIGMLKDIAPDLSRVARQASNLRNLFGAQKLAVAATFFSAGISRRPIHYCTPKMVQLLT